MSPAPSLEQLDASLARVAAEDCAVVRESVDAVRGKARTRTPAEAIRVLNAWYLRGEAVDGGLRAAKAEIPGGRALAATGDELLTSLDRTVVYLLALADLHGLDIVDAERRKTLVVGVLLGDEGAQLASTVYQDYGTRWARGLAARGVAQVTRTANPLLGQLLAHAVRTGLAMTVSAGGDVIRAQGVVTQAARAFGPAPATFPGQQPRTTREPRPNSVVYARALARTIHKARKRREGGPG